jgi:hypothetical protein
VSLTWNAFRRIGDRDLLLSRDSDFVRRLRRLGVAGLRRHAGGVVGGLLSLGASG